jgi:hypothetical protein
MDIPEGLTEIELKNKDGNYPNSKQGHPWWYFVGYHWCWNSYILFQLW